MSMPVIVKQWPPGPCVEDENGLVISRRWSILSTSELSARNFLKSRGVYRGSVFTEDNGSIPQPYAICQRLTIVPKRPAPLGGLGEYVIDVEYSTQQGLQRAVPGGPAVFSIRNSLVSENVDIDGAGKPILTSSEEPLDPPLTALRPSEVLHSEFYVKAPDAITAYIPLRPYNGTLNSGPFFGAKKGSLLCHVFQPQASDTGYVLVQVDFEFKKPIVINGKSYEGWHTVTPDRGFRVIANAGSTDPTKRYKYITTVDDQGNQVRVETPYPLNGKGQKSDPSAAAPTMLDINHYTYMNFNGIPGMRLN